MAYNFNEYVDMLLCLGASNDNASEAAREYARLYPQRRHPEGMGRFAAAVSPRPFHRQPFRHGDVSPRPFPRHLNLITAVMIDSIFTDYATHISRNLNFILDH
jgi:hypothetical protein